MSDTARPKRPVTLQGRIRTRPPPRDPRSEATGPDESRRRRTPRPEAPSTLARAAHANVEAMTTRIATIETELVRLKEERGAEADEMARILVRMAESERARAAAEENAELLTQRVRELETRYEDGRRELDAIRLERQHGVEKLDLAMRRAGLAERSAADGAVALERAHAEREADQVRLTDLEAKLARLRREHVDELTSLRDGLAEANHRAARVLEEERSAAARARQQAAALEVDLAAMRDLVSRAVAVIEELERREEMAAGIRARSLEHARLVLSGEAHQASEIPGEPESAPTSSDDEKDVVEGERMELDLSE